MIDEHHMFYFTFVGGQEKSFTGTKPGVIAVRGLVLENDSFRCTLAVHAPENGTSSEMDLAQR